MSFIKHVKQLNCFCLHPCAQMGTVSLDNYLEKIYYLIHHIHPVISIQKRIYRYCYSFKD